MDGHEGTERRNERRLEEAQRVAHIGSFEWDITPNVVTWSDELHRIYGLQAGEFGGSFEGFLAHVYPDDLELTKHAVVEALRVGQPFVYDHRIIRRDGAVRVLHTRGDIIRNSIGRPVRVVGSCWDVTELREATARSERTMSLLQATLEATADGLVVIDLAGNVSAYNQRLLDLWGLTKDIVEHTKFEGLLELTHALLSNADACMTTVRWLESHHDEVSFDSLQFVDGRFFERYSRPQKIGEEIVGRVWSYRDVTAKEQLLRRSVFLVDAERLLSSLDAEPALVSVARLTARFFARGCAIDLVARDTVTRVCFIGEDEGFPAPPVRSGEHGERSAIAAWNGRSLLVAPIVGKRGHLGTITLVAKPGQSHGPAELPLIEELAHAVACSLDNAQLFSSAQDAVRARDEFLAIAAHEIRGPLTSLISQRRSSKVQTSPTPSAATPSRSSSARITGSHGSSTSCSISGASAADSCTPGSSTWTSVRSSTRS